MKEQDLQLMKYVELQKLAKCAGIRANQKVDKLVRALTEYYASEEKDTSEESRNGMADLSEGSSAQTTLKLKGSPPKEVDNTESRGKKRRRTFELEEATLKGDSTPTIGNDQPRISLRTSRNSTPQNESLNQPIKRLRRNTFDKESPLIRDKKPGSDRSPGTRAIIDSIDGDCSSAERKEKLLSAIDKKVQLKMVSSPSNPLQTKPSQIPRFMTFLSNQKKESQKPITPGNKNWNKIHKKEFSKFDSIDVYLERKQQRKENLSASTTKQWTKKSPAVKKTSAKIVKPVSKSKDADSSKIFKPTVISTKNINFDFSKIASDSSKTPKTKGVQTPARKNAPTSTKLKELGTLNRATPFKFTGNTSSLNTTVTSSKKPVFDLKASLARPLTWKPHTGKLNTMDVNISHSVHVTKPSSVSASSKARKIVSRDASSKLRPRQAKDVRRAAHLDRRNNQKYVDMMKRRGLMA